jgi:flagellar biosynthesis protein FliR
VVRHPGDVLSQPNVSFTTVPTPSEQWLIATVLLATRLGGLLLLVPPVGSIAIPAMARLLFVLALAAILAAGLPSASTPATFDTGALISAAVGEFTLGATMSLGISLGFAAFTTGARLIDVQMGFGMGQVFDPSTRQLLPVLSGAFKQLALWVFFATDGHVSLLRGVALSIERFPPGTPWPLEGALVPLVQQVSALFALGFAIVAPVVCCLVLVEMALGVVSRSLPQMNMFLLGIPVKIMVGLAALSVWVASSSGVVTRVHSAMFAGWEALFR